MTSEPPAAIPPVPMQILILRSFLNLFILQVSYFLHQIVGRNLTVNFIVDYYYRCNTAGPDAVDLLQCELFVAGCLLAPREGPVPL